MKYTIDKQEKYSLLRLHEDKLDSSVAPGLKSELITLHAEGVRNIVLDMAEVEIYRFFWSQCPAGRK
jgi:anti-anti-sigma regulatory factor